MKTKFKIYIGTIVSTLVLGMVSIIGSYSNIGIFNGNAGKSSYVYSLNSTNSAPLPLTAVADEATVVVNTANGNGIDLKIANVEQHSEAFAFIKQDGYLYNVEAISGMESLTATFTGTVELSYGLTGDNLATTETLTSGETCTFLHEMDYFKLNAKTDVTLTSLTATYICTSRKIIPTTYHTIDDLADVQDVFDGSAEYYNQNLLLTANIDCGGATLNIMAGEFTGTFEGQGYTISNFKTNKGLFNIINGTVRNVNLLGELLGSDQVGLFGFMVNSTGSIKDCDSAVIINTNRTYGCGFTLAASASSFTRCHSDWIVNVTGCTYLKPISRDSEGIGCSYSIIIGATSYFNTGLTAVSTRLSYDSKYATAACDQTTLVLDGDHETSITGTLHNYTGSGVTWALSTVAGFDDILSATQSDNVFTFTGLATGETNVTLVATLNSKQYAATAIKLTVIASENSYIIPANAVEIGTAAQFTTFFNGSAENTNKNAVLTADIDLGGITRSMGMAGEYNGIFEGQGHTISNFSAGQPIINIMSSTSEVRNMTITCTFTASGYGIVAFQNNGKINNVTTNITIANPVNTLAGITLVGSGSFTKCRSNWTFLAGATGANTLYPIVQNDAGKTITNCSYSYTGMATSPFMTSNANITLIA